MQTIGKQPTQPAFTPPAENQPAEVRRPFFLTHRQLILIGIISGLVLLFIFGLGVRAGEKRALREQLKLEAQPTPTNVPFTPTPITSPTAPVQIQPTESDAERKRGEAETPGSGTVCERDVDCLSCFAVPGTLIVNCDAGRCVNGICVWEKPSLRLKRHE